MWNVGMLCLISKHTKYVTPRRVHAEEEAGSWDTLIMPEGSASGHVWMKHICIPDEGQPLHLDHITLPPAPTHHGRSTSRLRCRWKVPRGLLLPCTYWKWKQLLIMSKQRNLFICLVVQNVEWVTQYERREKKERESYVMLFALQIPNYLRPSVRVSVCVRMSGAGCRAEVCPEGSWKVSWEYLMPGNTAATSSNK